MKGRMTKRIDLIDLILMKTERTIRTMRTMRPMRTSIMMNTMNTMHTMKSSTDFRDAWDALDTLDAFLGIRRIRSIRRTRTFHTPRSSISLALTAALGMGIGGLGLGCGFGLGFGFGISPAHAASSPASASSASTGNALQAKMDAIFGEMSNVTAPGVYNTQRRGVISGGSVISRNRIVNTSLLNLQVPNASGSCGGIDAFAGSLSFINADQFVALLRAIASNAKGYAFKIALDAASSLIGASLSELQAVIQKMNDLNINSCELAQGIVNSGLDAVNASAYGNGYKLESALSGFTDVAQAFRGLGNSGNAVKEIAEKGKNDAALGQKLDNLSGNIVWKELKRHNARGMMLNPGSSDKDEYGILMAITGTRVVADPTDNASNAQTSDVQSTPYPSLIDPEDLIKGGSLLVYSCRDDDCRTLEKQSVAVTSLKQKIRDAIVGDGVSTGIITKYRLGTGFSAEEQKIMQGMPSDAGMMLSNLALNSPELAVRSAEDISHAIAMHYAFDMTKDYLNYARYAVSTSKMADKETMIEEMDRRSLEIQEQYAAYVRTHTPLSGLLEQYNAIMRNVQHLPLEMNLYLAKGGDATVR